VVKNPFSKQKTQPFGWVFEELASLGNFDYGIRLGTLLALNDLELNLIAFLKTLVALRLYGAVMDEHIGSALLADESKAFRVIEPLNCSLNTSHLHTFPDSFFLGRTTDSPRPNFQNFPWGLHKEIY
jgi:hypothetical protein